AGAFFMGWIPGVGGGGGKVEGGGKDKGAGGGGGAMILDKKETLNAKDPAVEGKPTKTYKVKLEAGKEYVIDMRTDKKGLFYDPYLRLLDPQNKKIAEDD